LTRELRAARELERAHPVRTDREHELGSTPPYDDQPRARVEGQRCRQDEPVSPASVSHIA
jgi:hypothetical protein